MNPIILDGRWLAAQRAPVLAARARAVTRARGVTPRLCLLAFEDAGGSAPHVAGKLRACAEVGIDVTPLILSVSSDTDEACRRLNETLSHQEIDGLFVQFPFPAHIDEHALTRAIPEAADVDVMSPGRIRTYGSNADAAPPVTVAAALALLDAFEVEVRGRRGVVVGVDIPFHDMFCEALIRRGAHMAPLCDPAHTDLEARLAEADLVVVSAAQPHLVSSRWLAPGSVVIDAGYFNAGGRGDVDVSAGVSHLAALAPVPGGIGPMTVSMLLEAVIGSAEAPPPTRP